jgi:hypothetical protein
MQRCRCVSVRGVVTFAEPWNYTTAREVIDTGTRAQLWSRSDQDGSFNSLPNKRDSRGSRLEFPEDIPEFSFMRQGSAWSCGPTADIQKARYVRTLDTA